MLDFGDPALPERYWAKVAIRGTGCWEWTASIMTNGYGCLRVARKTHTAHRLMAQAAHPNPDNLPFVLHSCDNRKCVNPSHLRWGTPSDNMKDSWERSMPRKPSPTHCPRGHQYSEENTYRTKQGTNACRICYRRHWAEWNKRRQQPGYKRKEER